MVNRKFWCRGYFVDTVGRNKNQIQEYIRNQLKDDYMSDQLTLFEEFDPFTGEKNQKKIRDSFANQVDLCKCGARREHPFEWAF